MKTNDRTIMTTKTGITAALLTVISLAAEAQDNQDVERGRMLAEENCARCHAVGSTGDSPFDEAPPFRVVAERYPPSFLAEALAEGIVVGHPEMPAFVFDDPDIDGLIAYLESLRSD